MDNADKLFFPIIPESGGYSSVLVLIPAAALGALECSSNHNRTD